MQSKDRWCTPSPKVDNMEMRTDVYDFYSLGFGEPYPISGSHGLGLGDLLMQSFSFGEEEEILMMESIRLSSYWTTKRR